MTEQLPAPVRAQAPVSFDDMERMAESFARSGLFGAKTKEQALSLLMLAQAEGTHPALAMQEFDVIEGKPARKSERIQARFQMSGGKVEFLQYSDTVVEAQFSHPQGASIVVKWTIEQARAVKYYTKDGWKSLAEKANWKNYPRAMLKARVMAEGCRACFPGFALVTLSTEEAIDGGTLEVVGEETLQAPFLGGAEKDRLVEDWCGRMRAAVTTTEIDEIENEYRSYPARFSDNTMTGLEHVRAEEHARCEDGAKPRPIEPSPFEDLKAQGLACLNSDDKLGAFREWTKRARAKSLVARCSPNEREELKAIWKNVRGAIAEEAAPSVNG